MNPLQLFATLLLEAMVAGVMRFVRFLFGPRGAVRAWEYAQALAIILLVAGGIVLGGIVVAGFLGYQGYVSEARTVLVLALWAGLPALIVLFGGIGFAADLLVNGLAARPKKEDAKEIFRGFLGIPLWLLVVAEVMLVVGVYAPMAALVVGPLGAMGILLLSLIRKWKFTFGWEFASAVQIVFITYAILASVPSSFWRATVGENLRPHISLAWAVPVDERELDEAYQDVAAKKATLANEELNALHVRIRSARTREEIADAERHLALWEQKYVTSSIKDGFERLRGVASK